VIFHASAAMIYTSGDYHIHWNTMGWSAWNYQRKGAKARICHDLTLAQAIKACESDALQTKKG
jgi:hypothetical protein